MRALALVIQGSLFLAACGSDTGTGMPPAVGAGTAAPAPSGTGATPSAGTGMVSGTAGKGTSGTGASGTGPATAGKPAGGTAGTGTSGTGAATAGTGTGTAGMPMTTAGTGTGGSGGMAAGGTGGAMATAGTGGGALPTGFPEESACLKDITTFDKDGPFKYTAMPQGAAKMWVPMVPAGCKVPVIHLSNGTGANCGNYQQVLNRLASFGFLSTCYEDPNTGNGTQGMMALTAAFEKFPDLAAKRIGSTGHSQGGQAAFVVLQLAEAKWGLGGDYTYTGLAMEPASGFGNQPAGGSWQSVYAKIKSPMFMFSGTADMLVSQAWVAQAFDALDDKIEAYHWSAIGATHIPTPEPQTAYIAPAWFRWKLLNDQKACEWFLKQPGGGMWTKVKEQNAKMCTPQ